MSWIAKYSAWLTDGMHFLYICVFYLVWVLGLWSFNVTCNNISALQWQSVLLVEETEVPGENHQPVTSHRLFFMNF